MQHPSTGDTSRRLIYISTKTINIYKKTQESHSATYGPKQAEEQPEEGRKQDVGRAEEPPVTAGAGSSSIPESLRSREARGPTDSV